ncbi:MAG: AIPR family protein, partial [Pseudohongiellaceae bacterium]
VVSLGAQKNFADFASRIGSEWDKSDVSFNEEFFREVVAKAIVFKCTEKIVSGQPWYQGGYRANIVAYAIAKMAHDAEALKRAVDFRVIWKRQSVPEEMQLALAKAAKAAHDVLVAPPSNMRNVTEWAKKQPCWERVRTKKVNWPEKFVDSLISIEEQADLKQAGKKDQKILNGIEAQTAVVNAGSEYWQEVMEWGAGRDLLSEKEIGVLRVATRKQGKPPSEKQAELIMKVLTRLRDEGFNRELPT